MTKPTTYGRIENGVVVEQVVVPFGGSAPETGIWLPIVVELQDYNGLTHQETERVNIIEPTRIVRTNVVAAIPVTPDMVRAECQRRIIAACGARDLMSALIKQLNDETGTLKPIIAALREKSNALEGEENNIPLDFRDDKYWAS